MSYVLAPLPPREIVKVLVRCGVVYVQLHKNPAIRHEDVMHETSAVGTHLHVALTQNAQAFKEHMKPGEKDIHSHHNVSSHVHFDLFFEIQVVEVHVAKLKHNEKSTHISDTVRAN